jgi:hypothetical protein
MPGLESTKGARVARRKKQRGVLRMKEEQNRRRAMKGGQPNELGILQGQNAEQGPPVNPRQAKRIGRSAH